MDYFIFQDNELTLNKEVILLVKEFADLWQPERNKAPGDTRGQQRKRAFKEFAYMSLAFDWESPYKAFTDKDKYETALYDSGLTDTEYNDELFQKACKKYQQIQETRMTKLLKSTYRAIDELELYFATVDLQERDMDGRPIFNAKQLNDTLAGMGKTITSLETLEAVVRKQQEGEGSKLRGDRKPGIFD